MSYNWKLEIITWVAEIFSTKALDEEAIRREKVFMKRSGDWM
jgi:hypothetical protein